VCQVDVEGSPGITAVVVEGRSQSAGYFEVLACSVGDIMKKPKGPADHFLYIYCRQLRVCNAQLACAACESDNAEWLEAPAGELDPRSAAVKVTSALVTPAMMR
jgi:hypothetical protein